MGSPLLADIQDTISYKGKPVICPGGQVVLTGANAPANSTFKWYKDKQTSPVATTPAYTVTTAGSYVLNIVSNGVSYTYPALIVTNSALPVANFIAVNNPECASEPITFKNLSTGDGLKYLWGFGDPAANRLNRSTDANPVHQFVGKPGDGLQTFTVSLTVTNKGGCSQTISKDITLKQSPGTEMDGTGATVYADKDYFVQCINAPTVFTFINNSSTKNTNVSYNLYWGDGSGQIKVTDFTTMTHRYRPGLFVLFYTVVGKNGCSITKKYRIFVGEAPKAAFTAAVPVNTCTGTPVAWSLSNLKNNTQGTLYTATYSDGTIVNYDLPPDTLMHTFLSNSVNKTSSYGDKTYNNAFLVNIEASNPCGSATAVSEPIYVSDPPKAVINSAQSAICLNTLANIKSVGVLGYTASAEGYHTNKLIWKITPATGFEANNDLGSGQADGDVKNWIGGTDDLNIRFTKAGNYNITLIAGSELCGIDSASVQICVTDLPVALFDVDVAEGCSPLIVKTTNKSNKPLCNTNSYKWHVTYKPDACNDNKKEFGFLNQTSDVSENPVFKFTKSGTYTISLVNSYPIQNCTSEIYSREIIIKQKPIVYLKAPDVIYKDQSFKPTIVATNCSPADQLSFAWEYSGGSAIFSQGELDSVKYNNLGRYNLSVKITSSCGFTEATVEIEVIAKPTFFIPNTFTPNNDGVNDTWSIRGLDSNPRNALKIFNRTGSLLYEATTNLTPWDGQFMGKRLPAGVYYYTLYSGVAKQAFSGWISMIY